MDDHVLLQATPGAPRLTAVLAYVRPPLLTHLLQPLLPGLLNDLHDLGRLTTLIDHLFNEVIRPLLQKFFFHKQDLLLILPLDVFVSLCNYELFLSILLLLLLRFLCLFLALLIRNYDLVQVRFVIDLEGESE